MLGVRDTPTGPDKLLERICYFAKLDNPPIAEIQKLYYRLDNLYDNCITEDLQKIKLTFESNKVILNENSGWSSISEIYLSTDDSDDPDSVSIVHSSIRSLSLWRKIGVADRPSSELSIKWLLNLASGQALSQNEIRRVRALLPKLHEAIWNDCRHWLNLQGEWAPIDQLIYSISMQTLVPWSHLFKSVKQKTADLQKLPVSVCSQPPFSNLTSLSSVIEDRFVDDVGGNPTLMIKQWIKTIGNYLIGVVLENADETERIRKLAYRLANTSLLFTSNIKIIPYIENIPVGTALLVDCLWKEQTLFVQKRSDAKLASSIAQEIGKHFNRAEIADAIKLCYERSDGFIIEYLDENFNIVKQKKSTK